MRMRGRLRAAGWRVGVCLVAVGFVCVAGAQPVAWEVRRAQLGDQKEEWTELGYVPGWEVRIGPGEAPTIEITGDEETGDYRGFILAGRKWRAPDPVPPAVRVRLRYQTYCAADSPEFLRAGWAALALMTPERWEQFATDPARAEKFDVRAEDEGIVGVWTIHRTTEDVTEWRDWDSGNIARRLRGREGEELVLAIVWWAAHFNTEEWAKFADMQVRTMTADDLEREFLESLDVERAELREVRAALERDDAEGAKRALVAHMRTRKTPVGPPLSPDGSERGIAAADQIVDHVFRLVGCPPTKLGETIEWNEDPHDYDQWAIALNRHNHWVTLGRAYAATGDEKYAEEFVAQLNGWVDAMPVHIGRHWVQGPFFEAGKNPLTLDAGIRMAQTWWPAYYYFKDSPHFDVDSQVGMVRSFRDHAVYLMDRAHFHETSNWGAMEANGLLHIAVMLPEFREADEWLRTAQERLVEAQKAQVYPDGAQIELATGYHGVTLGNFLGALEVARRNDVELPEEFVRGLEMMFEYYVAITMPNGRTPALNDGSWGGVRGWMARGLELFPERSDFQYLATSGKEGRPPERTSWMLPYAGWCAMRAGWEPEDEYLHFEAGPYGAGHQHEDKLSIVVHAGRHTILTEGGNYAYDSSDWRRYVLSTRAHNTVMVDGLDQNRRRQRETFVVWEPEENRWVTNDDFDYAEGVYSSGYGPDGAVDVMHTRQVVFVKPDYWIVIDAMTPADEVEHKYEALFHFDAEDAAIDEATRSVTAQHEGSGLRIVPLRPEDVEVEIIKGQTEPAVQGWVPTGRHNELRPIPTAVFRWRAVGPSVMAYALVPRDGEEGWLVQTAQPIEAGGPSEIAAEIALATGGRDLFVRRGGDAGEASIGPLQTDAEVAVVRIGPEGAVGSVLQLGGSKAVLRAE